MKIQYWRLYISEKVGLPTLRGHHRQACQTPAATRVSVFEALCFADGIEKIEDLKPGMKLPGVVTNVTAFGAFVDIGVHQDGLVHISQLSDKYVRDPSEVVKVHQRVSVTVLEVNVPRKRISLSMKS